MGIGPEKEEASGEAKKKSPDRPGTETAFLVPDKGAFNPHLPDNNNVSLGLALSKPKSEE